MARGVSALALLPDAKSTGGGPPIMSEDVIPPPSAEDVMPPPEGGLSERSTGAPGGVSEPMRLMGVRGDSGSPGSRPYMSFPGRP